MLLCGLLEQVGPCQDNRCKSPRIETVTNFCHHCQPLQVDALPGDYPLPSKISFAHFRVGRREGKGKRTNERTNKRTNGRTNETNFVIFDLKFNWKEIDGLAVENTSHPSRRRTVFLASSLLPFSPFALSKISSIFFFLSPILLSLFNFSRLCNERRAAFVSEMFSFPSLFEVIEWQLIFFSPRLLRPIYPFFSPPPHDTYLRVVFIALLDLTSELWRATFLFYY